MPNRLASATSPYLLQHKDNPVDWHEWGDEAFAEARERDVPVLLSVGYAACHWCHVMAHESFEDPETAAEMNRLFVNVKVDREERPDVDAIYMEAVQAMSGQGGWPMTVWLDPDERPFFAGTYFPNEPRHGMASFGEVITAVSTAWATKRDDIVEQAERLVEAISQTTPTGALANDETLRNAYSALASQFDPVNGGFGAAPKFPQQPVLEFLLRVHEEGWADRASHMVEHTLDQMAAGGIHDQIGGGFARYSVDSQWLVPHFEKMLYDNAQLARLYLWAGVELGRADFVEVCRSTLDYLLRDLRHPLGGFYSSEDADSEGVEGKFYVWSAAEIRELLGAEANSFLAFYGVTEAGNFEGTNILNIVLEEAPDNLDEARQVLLEARSGRIRPGLDDKVISSWNGLAIRAFAEAGAALHSNEYLEAARDAARFVADSLISDGRLMRSWREDQTSVPGFLDDHAAMAVGLFALYAATGEIEWYETADGLVNMLERFTNLDGGYFSTADDSAALIKRPTDASDNPLPSGNALAAEALLLSALYTGDTARRTAAEGALESVGALMEKYPSMVAHHLAVSHTLTRTKELAIVGEEWEQLAEVFWARFRPHVALAGSLEDSAGVVPLLNDRLQAGQTLAYVCEGFVCDLPTDDAGALAELLG
jgi:uncharacterized protein YyaL (SSP411 family)